MLPLETKRSADKLLPHSDLRGGMFLEEVSRNRQQSVAARLLRLQVRIAPGAWVFVCCASVLCVLSGRGLCDELITRTEESYRLWYVVVSVLETLWLRRPLPNGAAAPKTNNQTDMKVISRETRKTVIQGVLKIWLCNTDLKSIDF
jgi:hypothetical protein